MYSDITGIILSGGKSKRMKENKSFLKLGDKYIIEIISELMKSLFKNVILITNDVSDYKFLKLESYSDLYKEKGPLGGIHSGLLNSITDNNFIISCDMPLISKEIIEFIINYNSDKLIKVPIADGFIQQLCGLYNKECISSAEMILKESYFEKRNDIQAKRKCNVLKLLDISGAEIIDIENEYSNYEKYTFMNMNTPEEYKFISENIWKR